ELGLDRTQNARLFSILDQKGQFLDGVREFDAVGWPEAAQPKDAIAGPVHQGDLQRQRLGDQLPKDDMQEGDGEEGKPDSDRMRSNCAQGIRKKVKQGCKKEGKGRSPPPTKRNAGERDP